MSGVLVTTAMLSPAGDHTRLAMRTTDGMDIEFELDDLALSLLGVTLNPVLQMASKTRPKPTIFKKDSEV